MKRATCECGKEFTAADEDTLVQEMREHAKRQHGTDLSRDKIREIAKDG